MRDNLRQDGATEHFFFSRRLFFCWLVCVRTWMWTWTWTLGTHRRVAPAHRICISLPPLDVLNCVQQYGNEKRRGERREERRGEKRREEERRGKRRLCVDRDLDRRSWLTRLHSPSSPVQTSTGYQSAVNFSVNFTRRRRRRSP